MQKNNSFMNAKSLSLHISLTVVSFLSSTLVMPMLCTFLIILGFTIKRRSTTSLILLLFSYGALKFFFDIFLSWNISQSLANVGITIVGLHLHSRELVRQEFLSLRVRQGILSILSLFSLFTLLGGDKRIMNNLLVGYDNVGHFSMIKVIAECQGFLTNCEKTGIATPEGYRYYPQYFHFVFSSFFESLESAQQLKIYFVISTIVFLLNVNLAIKIIDSKKFRKFSISTKDSGNKGKRKPPIKKSNLQKKLLLTVFSILSALSITYIHSLGYINLEFSLLALLTMIIISQQSTNKLQVLFLFVLAAASSSAYPLMSLPNTAVLFFIVYQIYKQTETKIPLYFYSFTYLIFLGNLILNNLNSNFRYMTTSGGNIFIVLVVGILLVSYFVVRFPRVDSLRSEFNSLEIVDFAFVTYGFYSILLLLYNYIKGESIGYYTQKMAMVVFVFAIPVINRIMNDLDLFNTLFKNFSLKVVCTVLVFSLVFGNSYGALISAYRSNFTFLINPIHYLSEFFSLRPKNVSQSERILLSANLPGYRGESLVMKSATGPQDTIWVNAIRSTWSTQVDNGLQQGLLQESKKEYLTTIQIFDNFEIAVLKK